MAFGADRTVKVNLTATVTDYIGKLTAAQKKTSDLSKDISRMSKTQQESWNKIGRGATIAGAGIVAALGGAAKAYMDFEAAMSGVAAVADANAQQLKALSDAAVQAGQDTVFSASEAAKAEAELAKAGVSVEDILGGGLKGALDLAAAGQIDLANAATISAQAMNIFKLRGEDVGHIADVLTAGANKSAAGVDDLGQALAQGGLLAKQTGLSLEETVGALSAFADNALIGSDAGTSLKTMLQRLTPQTDAAAALMDSLNLSAYDTSGNFIGLANYAGKLQEALAGMSAEQRNSTLQTLFGSDAVRGANILYEEGARGIVNYINAVDDIGAAQRMAARQTDNLKGDLEQLKGTLESAFINAGSGGNEGLRSMVQNITDLVNKFNELPPSTQANIVQFAALTAGLLLASGAAIKATTSILAMKASMDAAGISGAKLATVTKALGAAAVVAGVAALSSELQKMQGESEVSSVAVEKLAGSLDQLNQSGQLTGGVADLFRDQGGWLQAREGFVSTSEAVDRFAVSAKDALGSDLTNKLARLQDGGQSVAKFEKQVRQLDAGLADMVRNGHATEAKDALDKLLSGMDRDVADKARQKFTDYAASLDETAVSATAAAEPQTGLSENLQKVQDNADEARKAVDDYIKSLQDAGLVKLDTRSAKREFQQSVDDAAARLQKLKDLKKELAGVGGASDRTKELQSDLSKEKDGKKRSKIQEELAKSRAKDSKEAADQTAKLNEQIALYTRTLDINTQAGRDNQAAIDAVAKSALDQAQAIYDETGSEESYRASLVQSRTQLVKVAEQFGMSKTEAGKYADAILNIPPKASTDVTVNGIGSAKAAVDGLRTTLEMLKDKTVHVNVLTGRIALPNGRKENVGQFADGGHVTGPGTGTSDSIPAYLSNGEYVVKAASVAKYGSHFFDRLNSMKFASGGFVGPSQSVSTHSETNNSPVYIDKVMGVTIADVEAEAERRRRTAALRGL